MVEKKIKALLVVLGITLSVSFLSWYGSASFADIDKDGIADSVDNCLNLTNPVQSDFDGDKIGDPCDADDDNDGITDIVDKFDTNPTEWADFDFDGIGSTKDIDDDNDGELDENDLTPVPISEKLTQQYLVDIESCALQNGTSRLLCYGDFFGYLVEQEIDDKNPLELALALSQIEVLDDCHFVAHVIGHAVFDETLTIPQNFGVNGSLCRGGYFHGVMGAFFHNLKENNNPIPDNLTASCNSLIGSSSYVDCIHGIGHGLVNYYPANLESTTEYCHQMSYYQYYACTSGVMMQYTDNQLTDFGATKENLSNMCLESELSPFEFQMCSKNLGISLAFHNNHDLEKSSESCQMIENEQGRDLCLEQTREEISKYQRDKKIQFLEKDKEKFQPQWIKQGDKRWIVDFLSSSVISDFGYNKDSKEIRFSFDAPKVIGIYVWNELLSDKVTVTINGVPQTNVVIQQDAVEPITAFRITPTTSGTVVIASLT